MGRKSRRERAGDTDLEVVSRKGVPEERGRMALQRKGVEDSRESRTRGAGPASARQEEQGMVRKQDREEDSRGERTMSITE